MNLIQTQTVVFGFHSKIDFAISTLNRNDFRLFESLTQASVVGKYMVDFDVFQNYTEHLKQLKKISIPIIKFWNPVLDYKSI